MEKTSQNPEELAVQMTPALTTVGDWSSFTQEGTTSSFQSYHRNAQYSIAAISDSSGAVVERMAYDSYGNTTILAPDGVTVRTDSAIKNIFGYTGREYDTRTTLYHFRARYYSPQLGRFVSRDPLGYVDGGNLYACLMWLTKVAPAGLHVPSYTIGDISKCRSFLANAAFASANGLGTAKKPCAAELLKHFLDSKDKLLYESNTCTKAVENLLNLNSILEQEIESNLKCCKSGNFPLEKTLPITFSKEDDAELYYAFHSATVVISGKCQWQCGKKDGDCCSCVTTCNLKLKMTDNYDFCSSYVPNPLNVLDELARCGCILEDYAKQHQGQTFGNTFYLEAAYDKKNVYFGSILCE